MTRTELAVLTRIAESLETIAKRVEDADAKQASLMNSLINAVHCVAGRM
jgi:hypothetical protein